MWRCELLYIICIIFYHFFLRSDLATILLSCSYLLPNSCRASCHVLSPRPRNIITLAPVVLSKHGHKALLQAIWSRRSCILSPGIIAFQNCITSIHSLMIFSVVHLIFSILKQMHIWTFNDRICIYIYTYDTYIYKYLMFFKIGVKEFMDFGYGGWYGTMVRWYGTIV